MSVSRLRIAWCLLAAWCLPVACCLPWPGTTLAASAVGKPNVLFIIADDLRPQLGCYGDRVVKSPHIDRLAANSLRFDRAYVQSAVCSPSRNSMLSGLRPNTTGLRGFGVPVRERVPDVVTLPQHFKNHGYHSKAIGKIFHIYVESMLGSEDDPESWSEPLELPSLPVWGPEQTRIRQQLIAQARAAGQQFDHPHDWPRARTWDDSDVADDQMQDGESTCNAIDFLESWQGTDQPFFLAVGFVRPHLPFNAPRRYWDLYRTGELPLPTFRQLPTGAPDWVVTQGIVENYYQMPAFDTVDDSFLKRYLQGYLACISYVDACTGRLLDALDRAGHADNTIIVFLGDHGYQMGEYGSWGHKHSNFEISTRAPLLVSTPGRGGQTTNAITEFLDIYPSLCELAGIPVPAAVEGASFAALFDEPRQAFHEPRQAHREAAFSEMKRRGRIGRSVRTDRFRYTQWRNGDNRLVAEELYDHQADRLQPPPDSSYDGRLEVVNVVNRSEYTDTVERLSKLLQRTLPHRQAADSPGR